ncbi:MAG: class I SAM-dependent methyltransferase [Actinobacteria bacterium]|nr:class I SAM-dependent methyltransferase [Actinomycetota bacterium]
MSQPSFEERQLSFGASADAYRRFRPTYPSQAIDWVIAAATTPVSHVADVGAGTGALTEQLIQRGLRVDAVEPDAGMLETLTSSLPGVTAHQAPAEHLPLDAASVDAVFVAQAWHWLDHPVAADEFARVVRPGGVLGLLWNLRYLEADWMRDLAQLIGGEDRMVMLSDGNDEVHRSLIQLGSQWSGVESFHVHHDVVMNPDDLVGLIGTYSYVRLRADAADVLASVRELAITHPDLAGRERFPMPYVTVAYRAVRDSR